MRRLIVIAVVLVLALAGVSWASGSGDADGGTYTVRAIFENAAFSAAGEDVRIAGATVGSIKSIELTPDNKAEMTLEIDALAFTPFHENASCRIRAEGLLAVKFLDCDPGDASRPELVGADGEPAVLDVGHTSTPVDLDLVQSMWRQPAGQQLALLLSEFGVGLSGRGDELNETIRRAEPALRETDQVLRVLARQNDELESFSQDADAVVSQLASRRRELASFISAQADTAVAAGERDDAIAAGFERFPLFLRRLQGSMADLGALAEKSTPVLAKLRSAGADLTRGTAALPGFVDVAQPALEDLGESSGTALKELERTRPLIGDLGDLGGQLRPAAGLLDRLGGSLEDKRGLERLLEILFYGAQSTNGFDSAGHYARLELLSGTCSEYATALIFGCDAQWGPSTEAEGPITEGASSASTSDAAAAAAASRHAVTDLFRFLMGDGQ